MKGWAKQRLQLYEASRQTKSPILAETCLNNKTKKRAAEKYQEVALQLRWLSCGAVVKVEEVLKCLRRPFSTQLTDTLQPSLCLLSSVAQTGRKKKKGDTGSQRHKQPVWARKPVIAKTGAETLRFIVLFLKLIL